MKKYTVLILAIYLASCDPETQPYRDEPTGDDDTAQQVDLQCNQVDDFTACDTITEPDRSFDICVNDKCVSPGCGLIECNTPGPHFAMPDTGQTKCYDHPEGELVECSGEPDTSSCAITAFCGQDAQYGHDLSSLPGGQYTRIVNGAGNSVEDLETGLMWTGCLLGAQGENCDLSPPTEFTWDDALATCDGLDHAGFDDWRLPDRWELASILNYGTQIPAVNEEYFPGIPNPGLAWSSTLHSEIPTAFAVRISTGWTMFHTTDKKLPTLCTRSTPDPRAAHFMSLQGTNIAPSDEIVVDPVSALSWQRCPAGKSGDHCAEGEALKMNWRDALSYCQAFSSDTADDWRLPNINELGTIVDYRYRPEDFLVNTEAFPGTPSNGSFWSSTPSARGFFEVWVVSSFGSVDGAGKMDSSDNYVRCVR